MTDFKKTKKTAKVRGLASANSKVNTTTSSGGAHVVGQNTKIGRFANTGRFANGVKIVSKRDRDGLIKLADR